jgi:hypothetical protein
MVESGVVVEDEGCMRRMRSRAKGRKAEMSLPTSLRSNHDLPSTSSYLDLGRYRLKGATFPTEGEVRTVSALADFQAKKFPFPSRIAS